MRRKITTGISRAVLWFFVLGAALGCGRGGDHGEALPRGSVVDTRDVEVIVPRDNMRVSVDNPMTGDLVMYEDFGPGLPRGSLFLVQSRPGELKLGLIEELMAFGGPDAPLLDDARILSEPSSADLEAPTRDFEIFIPALEEERGAGSAVRRQALYMTGSLIQHGGRIYRIQVSWNPLFTRGSGSQEVLARAQAANREALDQLKSGTAIK